MSEIAELELRRQVRVPFKLRDIEFERVMGQSGVQGFHGEGYPYHRLLKMAFRSRFSFERTTFVAKTTTLLPQKGNMPLRKDGITPRGIKPKCIAVNFRKKAVLNAVGLSGPGLEALLEMGHWQRRKDSFMLSFMTVAKSRAERKEETRQFARMFRDYRHLFDGNVAWQINRSCPNVGLHQEEFLEETIEQLEAASIMETPLVVKISVLTDPQVAAEIARHPQCDAICVSNTIPFGQLPDQIDWYGLFGSETVSPLEKHGFGKGGLSGAPLLPILIDWLWEAMPLVSKPIIAGGGILSPQDVGRVVQGFCVHSVPSPRLVRGAIAVGVIAMLCPWNLSATIEEGHRLFDVYQ